MEKLEKNSLENHESEDQKRIIIKENASEEEKESFLLKIENNFYNDPNFENSDKVQYFMHPIVKDVVEGKRDFSREDKITVQYLDRHNRIIQESWSFYEYLRRIGFGSHKKFTKDPYDRFVSIKNNYKNLNDMFKKEHQEVLQKRNLDAHTYDLKLEQRSKENDQKERYRKHQLLTQRIEDPHFCKLIEKGGYIFPQKLSLLHDYLDGVDVLLEINKGEHDNSQKDEPVYLGIQRTLLPPKNKKFKDKNKQINASPIWFIPEYPERNPVLRVVYREDSEEYYSSNEEVRKDLSEDVNEEHAKIKTLDVLYRTEESLKRYLEEVEGRIDSAQERHKKYLEKYNEAVKFMIKKIELDTGLKRQDIADYKEKYKQNRLES